MLRGKDVHDIEEMSRMGLSISAINELTHYDRKTIRKYLLRPDALPACGPRPRQPSRLDAFKPYLEDRLKAGVAKLLPEQLGRHRFDARRTHDQGLTRTATN